LQLLENHLYKVVEETTGISKGVLTLTKRK